MRKQRVVLSGEEFYRMFTECKEISQDQKDMIMKQARGTYDNMKDDWIIHRESEDQVCPYPSEMTPIAFAHIVRLEYLVHNIDYRFIVGMEYHECEIEKEIVLINRTDFLEKMHYQASREALSILADDIVSLAFDKVVEGQESISIDILEIASSLARYTEEDELRRECNLTFYQVPKIV